MDKLNRNVFLSLYIHALSYNYEGLRKISW